MQVWDTDAAGGYMYSDQLSAVLRSALQPMSRFQQHCDADDFTDKGLNKGEAFTWNIYSDVATQGGRLTETTEGEDTPPLKPLPLSGTKYGITLDT